MKRLLLPLSLLAIVAAGCKPASLEGTYKGSEGDMVLNADKTFVGTSSKPSSIPGGNTISGTWKEENEKVTLTPDKIGGKPINEVLGQIEKMAKQFGAKSADIAKMKDALAKIEGTVDKDRKVITITILGKAQTYTKA